MSGDWRQRLVTIRNKVALLSTANRNRIGGVQANIWLYPQPWDIDYLHRVFLLRAIRRVADDVEGAGVLLDVGCGWRPYEALFKVDRYVGVDTRPHGNLDILLIEENGRIPVDDRSADLCTSWQVLEHVSDIETYFAEIRRCVVPGGILIVTTHGFFRVHATDDYWRWTKSGLRLLFEKQGFSDIQVNEVDNGIVSGVCHMNYIIQEMLCPRTGRGRKVVMLLLRPVHLVSNLLALLLTTFTGRARSAVRQETSTLILRCRMPAEP